MKNTLLIILILAVNHANALNITYEAIDLPDTIPGEDLWKYSYNVSDQLFDYNNGFSIFFGPLNYSNLENPAPAVNSDWDVLVLQPDIFLPDDGVYDALASITNPSLLDAFSLSFVWLGAGTPGSQPFALYNETFSIIATGHTLAKANGTSVPEPAMLFLLGSGFLALLGYKK